MKKLLSLLIFALWTLAVSAQTDKKITIIFTNDLHSRVTGFAPESAYTPLSVNDDNTRGGFARIASIINNEKSRSEGTTLVLDAGDFLMGTLFQSLEPETGFQLKLMKRMGYDVVCIGNHEFDFGPVKLASIISAASKGQMPAVLLSNAVMDSKDTTDNALEDLYNKDIIRKKIILEKDGLKIGFFSLMGKVADDNAAFAKPVTFAKQKSVAKHLASELKKEGCDLVICLSHSGVSLKKDGTWGGEDAELAATVKDIDVIISGHTHTQLSEALIIDGTPVVQTGEYGKNVGKLSLTVKGKGNLTVEGYSLIPVDDQIKGDAGIQEIVEKQKDRVAQEVLKPIGLDYVSPLAESSFLLECNEQGDFKNSNLGPLVADAIYKYVNNHSEAGTDLSMVAVGVIRDRIVPGMQTAPDIFRIMSMGTGKDKVPGYPLARLYVTGKELKSILEILQVAYKSAPENYCFYSGLHVDFDPDGGMLNKIKEIVITNPSGTSRNVSFSRKDKTLYSVTANSYMLEFIGIIKKMSFGLINVVPKDIHGNRVTDMSTAIIDMDPTLPGVQEGKEWLAITELLRSMKDTNGNGIPDVDQKYSVPVKSFTEVSKK